jgi:hypothetical protein
MTFRFTTECELTIRGDSYEDIYLQFKEFVHGDRRIALQHAIAVYPPESVQVFFHTDTSETLHEIPQFKGDFKEDIAARCEIGELVNPQRGESPRRGWSGLRPLSSTDPIPGLEGWIGGLDSRAGLG